MKIAQYQTVSALDPRALDKSVNELLGNGWQPYGSPYALKNGVCQAMVTDKAADKAPAPQPAAQKSEEEPEPKSEDAEDEITISSRRRTGL
jgi:hypothetical protein